MRNSPLQEPNPALDLVFERVVEVPRDLVWEAWIRPEHLKAWFTPRPWRTVDCEVDLQPGGIFRTVMQGPNGGAEVSNTACYLEVVHQERLVWTDALLPGWRPAVRPKFGMTVVVTLESLGDQTRYTATAFHRNEMGRKRHEDIGFAGGWGRALDQLVEHLKARMSTRQSVPDPRKMRRS